MARAERGEKLGDAGRWLLNGCKAYLDGDAASINDALNLPVRRGGVRSRGIF